MTNENQQDTKEGKTRKDQRRSSETTPKQIVKWQQIHIYTYVIILDGNRLTAPIKRHRVTEWIKKQDPSICHIQETILDLKSPADYKWGGGKPPIMQTNVKRNPE